MNLEYYSLDFRLYQETILREISFLVRFIKTLFNCLDSFYQLNRHIESWSVE